MCCTWACCVFVFTIGEVCLVSVGLWIAIDGSAYRINIRCTLCWNTSFSCGSTYDTQGLVLCNCKNETWEERGGGRLSNRLDGWWYTGLKPCKECGLQGTMNGKFEKLNVFRFLDSHPSPSNISFFHCEQREPLIKMVAYYFRS